MTCRRYRSQIIVTLLSLIYVSLGSGVRDNRFVASFDKDTKSVGIVTELILERSKVFCAGKCMSRTLCGGFNYRKLSNGRKKCELIQGISEAEDVQHETSSVFYRIMDMKFPRYCADYYRNYGYKQSGMYRIEMADQNHRDPVEVYCEMGHYGGGWMLALSRYNGTTNFDRNWTDYKTGFGDINWEHYVGNDILHAVTASRPHEILITMESFAGSTRYARYDSFLVDSEHDNYTIHLGAYSGDAGDAFVLHDGMSFSTYDRDNDLSTYNCAATYHGGFWYNACSTVRLTGLWGETPADEIVNGTNGVITYHQGIIWSTWLTFLNHPKTAVMMIKPVR